MKIRNLTLFLIFVIFTNCGHNENNMDKKKVNIIFLHHSTGFGVWMGKVNRYTYKVTKTSEVEKLIKKYNRSKTKKYSIKEQSFPKREPYGWSNDPYDYYNIWVKNGGDKLYMKEPTLEILTKDYNVIVFKHCYPVSQINENDSTTAIDSNKRTIANYKLQYEALKQKMYEFPETKFVLWTGAALTKEATTESHAKRAEQFFDWVKNDWNEPDDNIFLWDFRSIETEGGLYLKEEYATSPNNSHPNKTLNSKAAKLFVSRLIDIADNEGNTTSLTGAAL